MKPTSSPSASSITSGSGPGATGQRRIGGSSERTSRGLPVIQQGWIDVLLGPVPCQGCQRPVCWVRWDARYRFWADPGSDVPHTCGFFDRQRQLEAQRVVEPEGTPLHRVVEDWKKALNGG